jgi:hypothetical protein
MFTHWGTMSSAELITHAYNIGREVWMAWVTENYAQKYIFISRVNSKVY